MDAVMLYLPVAEQVIYLVPLVAWAAECLRAMSLRGVSTALRAVTAHNATGLLGTGTQASRQESVAKPPLHGAIAVAAVAQTHLVTLPIQHYSPPPLSASP